MNARILTFIFIGCTFLPLCGPRAYGQESLEPETGTMSDFDHNEKYYKRAEEVPDRRRGRRTFGEDDLPPKFLTRMGCYDSRERRTGRLGNRISGLLETTVVIERTSKH